MVAFQLIKSTNLASGRGLFEDTPPDFIPGGNVPLSSAFALLITLALAFVKAEYLVPSPPDISN